MKTESKTYQLVGYGLYYRSNNQLIKKANDRIILQLLVDLARRKLKLSELPEITMERTKLCRIAGIEENHAGPASFKRLEDLGLININSTSSVIVNCDAYVTAVLHYESLSSEDRNIFATAFQKEGVAALKKFSVQIQNGSGTQLIDMTGTSISTAMPISSTENIQSRSEEIQLSTEKLQTTDENIQLAKTEEIQFKIQHLALELKKFSLNCKSSVLNKILSAEFFQSPSYSAIKVAFETGSFPSEAVLDPNLELNFFSWATEFFQFISQKQLNFFSTDIIYNIKKKINEDDPLKNEIQTEEENENFQDNIQKGFEGLGKVEILDLDKPSEEIEEDFKENDDISQLKLKRAERQLRERNSYRNKPFIKVERVKEIVDCLDEVVKSPVDFFIYQFWWGIFDLYCEHYHPSTRINEEGEIEDEPQLSDWKEMIGAALPQDEIYSIAQNVYEDMIGAIEQGKYVYGDDNEWEVSFGFTTFQDFNPYEIFQWSPCTMQDKSVPALKVAIDRFYDIEANDVFTPSKGCKVDKKTKNSQNKKLINLILSADDASLSPMESAIKSFYRDFVVSGDDNIIDEFTDGKGTALESGGGLPDHLLKPWCYNLSSVRYNEFTGVLCNKYKPCDGVHKKAYIFSAENVVEWNERNGYTDTIAHEALQ